MRRGPEGWDKAERSERMKVEQGDKDRVRDKEEVRRG